MNPGPQRAGTRLQHSIIAMLATLAIVAAGDAVIGSLCTGKIRLWFPVWFDPDWAVDPASPVVYSQSYIAGIALLLPLLHLIEQHALQLRPTPRKLYWLVGTSILAFIVWWKGSLMMEHGKEAEALLWFGLGLLGFAALDRLPVFPAGLVRVDRAVFLRRLFLGLAGFFWLMAVLDPALQVGVHGLPWSTGLLIEVAFFIPAGTGLLVLSRKLVAP